jgi:molybdopterin-guanine dinucleotide biosynthesis protein A
MISFFPQVEVLALDEEQLRPFDPHQTSFFNVNTPEDLRRAEEMLAAPGQSYSDDGGMSA